MLSIFDVIWKEQFIEKLAVKHRVTTEEVEEVLFGKSQIRRIERGLVQGENVYVAYGQTSAGRHLSVFFIRKHRTAALPISARDMTSAERRYFHEKKRD